VVQQQANRLQSDRRKMIGALAQAGETVMKRQVRHISIPRRFSQMARDIWTAQPRFHRTQGKQPLRLLAFRYFAPPTISCVSRPWWVCFRIN
jgi:poly(A) polymerase